MRSPLQVLKLVRRRLLIHRRGLAALCAAAAVVVGIRVTTAPPPPAVPVWTATRDLASGARLELADFRRTAYAPGTVPDRVVRELDDVVGRTLITPLERGEPVTSSKLLSRRLLAGYPGRSAIAVRLPDAALAGLLRPGDRIDLVATDPRAGQGDRRVSRDAVVLAVPPEPDGIVQGVGEGRLVLLAVASGDAESLATAAAAGFLTVIWNY